MSFKCSQTVACVVGSQVPNIALNPTLDGIQNAINSTAKAILQVRAHLGRLSGHCMQATWVRVMPVDEQPATCLSKELTTQMCLLQASNRLRCWGMVNGPPTYHDLIARDKEVVKSVLLLTGSIEHIKQQVAEYLAKFDKYSFLWTQDLQVWVCCAYVQA